MPIVASKVDHLRPRLHFTAPQAWLNDPHGICWVENEYHLFYQYNPSANEWASGVHWGHATSPDLMHWRHLPVALSPRTGEGCWTGTCVMEDGRPTIFYTSVDIGDPNVGKIAVALPDEDLRTWASSPADVVIEGPPPSLAANVFRDPCIFATDTGWTMIVGVGVSGGAGLAVQYSSPDRRTWTYDGVLCSRPSDATDECWTGSMWECPQLFRVGDNWVLAVSVWDADRLYYVAAAVGEYDGKTFTPGQWTRLTHDDISYAMTSFEDRTGRSCVMFWLREEPDHAADSRTWAGALSLPMLVEVSAQQTLRLVPHPDVDALGVPQHSFTELTKDLLSPEVFLPDATHGISVELVRGHDQDWEVALVGDTTEVFSAKLAGDGLNVERPGRGPVAIAVSGPSVRFIIDAGIVEIFSGGGVAAFRIPTDEEAGLVLRGVEEGEIVIHRLAPALVPTT